MSSPLIFDTTLRDGEQMPSVVFKPEEKVELARKFDEFGVDYIDVMPIVSDGEKYVTKKLVKERLDAEISALTRLKKSDIDVALECDVPRVLLFTSLSDKQRVCKLKISREENLEMSLEMIDYAVEHGLNVDFGGEDTPRLYRRDPEYLKFFIKKISNKIDYFFPADTIGCLLPHETYEFIADIKQNCKITLHQHNDLGLATANTLEGLRAGADGFSGTFTGIGERSGNAPIEEVCVALKKEGIDLDVKYEMLTDVCELVKRYSGVDFQKHKPIIGENAFSHESGIHMDAIVKDPSSYEVINPESIGRDRKFLFGKYSGRNGLKHALRDQNPSDKEISYLLKELKKMSESSKKTFSEQEIINFFKTHSKPIEVY